MFKCYKIMFYAEKCVQNISLKKNGVTMLCKCMAVFDVRFTKPELPFSIYLVHFIWCNFGTIIKDQTV